MSIHYAYNLCDGMEYFAEHDSSLPEHTEQIYLGSYFCDRYYCNTAPGVWQECFAAARKQDVPVVLVIPTPSQAFLELLKRQTRNLMHSYGDQIREVVVNDYGMLDWVATQYPELGIWLGRTMDKELRDPRYCLSGFHGKLLGQVESGWQRQGRILGVESDLTDIVAEELPVSRYGIGLHVPFAYVTMGRICEFASIGSPVGEKFQLYRPCNRQCMSHWMWFEQNSLCFMKHGRAVYTPVTEKLGDHLPDHVRVIESILAEKVGASCPGEKGECL